MAARAYWQGQIRLALVSIPVEIYPATKSGATVSFRQIHEPSGKRIAVRTEDRPIPYATFEGTIPKGEYGGGTDSFDGKVGHVAIREKEGGTEDYLVVDDGAAILACVQMGTIEFHRWGAPARDVEHPDRMVFDLDPDEGLGFEDVRHAAMQLRDLLGGMELASFPMASGGKGVHVVVPLDGVADWPRVKDFASRFARAVAEAHPTRFTANMRKSERKGRIFLDWLRNERGATAVLPYSVRARDTASVAAPVSWDELAKLDTAKPFSIADAEELLRRAGSRALKGWGEAEQALPDL